MGNLLLPQANLAVRLANAATPAAAPTSTPAGAGWQTAPGVAVTGLRLPPPPSPRGVGSYQPTAPPPSSRVSYTASPSGGAPGATFGPPGVAGAPVPMIGGFALTPGMLLLVGAVAVAGYLVLR